MDLGSAFDSFYGGGLAALGGVLSESQQVKSSQVCFGSLSCCCAL